MNKITNLPELPDILKHLYDQMLAWVQTGYSIQQQASREVDKRLFPAFNATYIDRLKHSDCGPIPIKDTLAFGTGGLGGGPEKQS